MSFLRLDLELKKLCGKKKLNKKLPHLFQSCLSSYSTAVPKHSLDQVFIADRLEFYHTQFSEIA